eukprot:2766625-Karenia_brevis.AAC.1
MMRRSCIAASYHLVLRCLCITKATFCKEYVGELRTRKKNDSLFTLRVVRISEVPKHRFTQSAGDRAPARNNFLMIAVCCLCMAWFSASVSKKTSKPELNTGVISDWNKYVVKLCEAAGIRVSPAHSTLEADLAFCIRCSVCAL